tara:strand:+ start:872 stop:1807 length:936 start_codon:yes stop_codon:yes gene_type:complete
MAKEPVKKNAAEKEKSDHADQDICGIIMPISPMGDHSAEHWSEVRQILGQSITKANMRPQIVSDSFETDIIQSRIIQNLYENPVVICDVSCLNPNVMFELGIRITFKKPVIIVADRNTKLPFDTSVIEHQFYPADLHYHQIENFIDDLASKIEKMAKKSKDGTFQSFIEQFGQFQVLEPKTVTVETDRYVLEQLAEIRRELRAQRTTVVRPRTIHGRDNMESDRMSRISKYPIIEAAFFIDGPRPPHDKIESTSRWINDRSDVKFESWDAVNSNSSVLRLRLTVPLNNFDKLSIVNMLASQGLPVEDIIVG